MASRRRERARSHSRRPILASSSTNRRSQMSRPCMAPFRMASLAGPSLSWHSTHHRLPLPTRWYTIRSPFPSRREGHYRKGEIFCLFTVLALALSILHFSGYVHFLPRRTSDRLSSGVGCGLSASSCSDCCSVSHGSLIWARVSKEKENKQLWHHQSTISAHHRSS